MATLEQRIFQETGKLLVTQAQIDEWSEGTFKGAWLPNTVYVARDQVTNGGNTYRRKADGTDGAVFIETDWDILFQGGSVANGTVSRAALSTELASLVQQLADLSGYVYVITDGADRRAFAIRRDGKIEGNFIIQQVMPGAIDNAALQPESVSIEKFTASVKSLMPTQQDAAFFPFAWAIVDANDRVAFGIRPDGSLYMPKLVLPAASVQTAQLATEVTGKLPLAISASSGYVWCIVDANDKVAIGIDTAGRFLVRGVDLTTLISGNYQAQIDANKAYITPSQNLVGAGDSLTQGVGGTAWPTQLSALLPTRTIINGGRGGDTSTQIAFRHGAITHLFSVANNLIPASGSVVVTPDDVNIIQAVSGQIAFQKTGTLFNVPGTLNRNPDGSYSFVRTTAGSAIQTDKKTVFIPDTTNTDFNTNIIWAGRNNYTNQATVLSDIAAMVALQKTVEKRFLVLSILNANIEPIGSTAYNQIIALNTALRAAYPRNYVDVREALIRAYDPAQPQDVTDFNNDVLPSSLRSDALHLNTAGYGVVAQTIKNVLTLKNW